jgi:hypothetical protein
MPSLSAKDRVSLCQFTFADGRRCRTPRTGNHPHFCFDHAQKEARALASESLGKDLAYFFSGNYLSACDLSTALARIIPAILRGDVKPRAARTVAYMAQTLAQTIRMSQDEYINAFGTDVWRKAIANSVNGNHKYLFPPAPKPTVTSVNCHSERSEEPASSPSPAPQPAPSPHTPLPPTSAEFVQNVVAGLPRSVRPGSTGKTGSLPSTPHVQPAPPNPRPATPPPQPPESTTNVPPPATQPSPSSAPAPPPTCPEQGQRVTPPSRRSTEPNRDAPWWDSRHLYDPPDSHLL